MTKLLYHVNGSGASPFDHAVLRVANRSTIKVISPYIGLRYLQRLINVSTGWTLVSDIEAWLSSLSYSERTRTWSFINANLDKIHHYPAIHAKTVIGPKLAYLGSANLTSTGILSRTEMGVMLEDPQLVRELNDWFDEIWKQTAAPKIDETTAFIHWLNQQAPASVAKPKKVSLSSDGERVHASLTDLGAFLGGNVALESAVQDESLDIDHEHTWDLTLDLKGSVNAVVEALATDGFSFFTFVETVNNHDLKWRRRELYFALLPFCANHPRSVFGANTINRLVLVDGSFVQSRPMLLHQKLAPFDEFLAALIRTLSFDEARPLPNIFQLRKLTGLRKVHQRELVESLLEVALLEVENENENEVSPNYILSGGFEWTSRFRLFVQAYQAWGNVVDDMKRRTFEIPLTVEATQTSTQTVLVKPTIYPGPVVHASVSNVPGDATRATRLAQSSQNQNSTNVNESINTNKNVLKVIVSESPQVISPHTLRLPTLDDWVKNPKELTNRIDKFYLEFSRLIDTSSGKFKQKTMLNFASNFVAKRMPTESHAFIVHLLEGKFPQVAQPFMVIVESQHKLPVRVEINRHVDLAGLPLTSRFIQGRIIAKQGYIYRSLADFALIYLNTRTDFPIRNLRIISQKDQALAHADDIYVAVIKMVQLYGNPMPFSNPTTLREEISRRTGFATETIIDAFSMDSNFIPKVLSIDIGEKNRRCRVIQNILSEDVPYTLPNTKLLLRQVSLKVSHGIRGR